MPRNTGDAIERRNSEASRLLNEYRATLQNNDYLISGLEVMQKIPEPTISQRARMKELEEQLIPEGIQREKDLGAKIRPLIESLQRDGSIVGVKRRAVIELRYLNLLGWDQVTEALYSDHWEDLTIKEKSKYRRMIFRYHAAALDQLDEILRSGSR